MRDNWEGRVDLDEAASITERDLRSLRRGARAGRLAMLLALAAAVAAGWSLLMGPDALAGFAGVQDVKLKVLAAIGQPIPAEEHQPQAPAPRPSEPQAANTRASSAPDSSATQLSVSNHR
ncbi:MAG: hypothetical protein E6K79_08980 [Candidatus Eisenbacteria bacterium]|uniref:Uncharacterized protein n=1 Tax=Eiseniibacteriota bacterium TaxID=2212470 RepID=A0A538TJI2_UNCEI|nr:MAG: hypothetical protein E6K79_08980 [Candidatus Eisenbacteria bacterium]